MADIRPFRAYRPKKDMESRIAALPYDVYNREEALKIVKENPLSFLAIDRAETQFGPDTDMYAPQVYEKARDILWEQINNGNFVQEPAPCYYLYQQVMDGRSQKGIVACASIDDYENNIIKRHENTRADKEADRIRHVDICDSQTGPIFLAYRGKEELRRITQEITGQEPVTDFVSEDGIGHRVWIIDEEPLITKIRNAFLEMPAVYIADGHHRCASAVKVGKQRREVNPGYAPDSAFNYFLAVLFPDEELRIYDYNRVVKDLNGLSRENFIQRVEESFIVKEWKNPPYRPAVKGTFGMYLKGQWYELKAKEAVCSPDAIKGLDVSILQDYLLEPVLGIQNPKTDKRIDFVGGIRGLEELERRVHTDMTVAFSMYPTSIDELFAVADAGRLMPPKSTWFEPKLRSGLFLHSLR